MTHKLVLLGDTSVGKSCIVWRLVRDEFYDFQEPTIGSAFTTQTISTKEKTVKFEIWDTAGQERYRSLAPMYYRGARVAIVVYDITNKDSLQGAKAWIRELKMKGPPDIIIALVGNKIDKEQDRKITYEETREYAEENELLFLETSAKKAINIQELFIEIAKKIPDEEIKHELFFKVEQSNPTTRGCCYSSSMT